MTFLDRFKGSTIGFSGYPRLLRDQASGFGFMALVLLIALAVSCVINSVQIHSGMTEAANKLAAGPDFALKNGQIEYTGPQPFIQQDGDVIIIVDTTGKTTVDAITGHAQGSLLLTKDTYYQVQGLGQIQTVPLSQIPLNLTKADIVRFMEKLWIIVPIGYIFIYGFQLGCKALDAVFLALAGLLYGSATNRQVSFGLGYKAGLYALTLPTLIQWIIPGFHTIPSLTHPIQTIYFLAWWALAILFVVMGLQAYFRDAGGDGQGWTGNV